MLEALHRGLRRREVYAEGADRWGDPRARLLDGDRWENARPRVLKALDLPAEPDAHLEALSVTLDDAYRQVASEIAQANGKAVIEHGEIRLDRLGPAPEPPGLERERQEMQRMMPRADIPELLLEVFARTGAVDSFTHISGATARMDELEVSDELPEAAHPPGLVSRRRGHPERATGGDEVLLLLVAELLADLEVVGGERVAEMRVGKRLG